MNELPLISIIVPVFNTADYLKECIESLLAQTYNNIEIILVDDGSEDESLKICEYYQNVNSNVIVISKKNGGQASARNIGLKIAKGSYISFIDSDDLIHRDMIHYLFTTITTYQTDIAECDLTSTLPLDRIYASPIKVIPASEWRDEIIFSSSKYGPCTRLYNRRLLTGIMFKEGVIYEDTYFLLDISEKVASISISALKLYYYRANLNSTTKSGFSIKRLDMLYAMEYLLAFLIRNDYQDKQIESVKQGIFIKASSLYYEALSNNIKQPELYNKIITFQKNIF